jgi:transposase
MTEITTRRPKTTFTTEQRLDYAKLMVNEGYTNKQIMEISGTGDSAVRRWKKQYLDELNGNTPENKQALTASTTKNTEPRKATMASQKGIMTY